MGFTTKITVTFIFIFLCALQGAGAMMPFGFWPGIAVVNNQFKASVGKHTCVINRDGRVKCWGAGANGDLGRGNTTNVGTAAGQMGSSLAYIDLGPGLNATQIAVGYNHSCVIFSDGRVKCWGANASGQLGLGAAGDRGDNANEMGSNLPFVNLGTGLTAKKIAAGWAISCAILNNDKVKCWGDGSNGSLGTGNTGSGVGLGASDMGDNLAYALLGTGRTAKEIMVNMSGSVCAILDDSTLKCWGQNIYGELGKGNTTRIGMSTTELGDNLTPISLGTGRTATAVTGGYGTICALLDNATVKCWGQGGKGVLGKGNTNDLGDNANEMGDNLTAISLGTGRTAKAIASGPNQVCAILDNDTLKCWGGNASGELGLGDTTDRGSAAGQMGDSLPTVNVGTGLTTIAVTAGEGYTCALLNTGKIKCWGDNSVGNLGYGDTTARGSAAGQMGDSLLPISWY
jgi:hypothetical protein